VTHSKPLVLITRKLPESWCASLYAHCTVRAGPAERAGWSDALLQHLSQAEGILCLLTETIDKAVLERAPRLRVVSNMAVGVDNIDVAACSRRGIPVGHTPGVLTEATADLTMALLLAAARRIPEAAADARAGRWSTWSPTGWLGADLSGATLGIIGMGKIGRAVAKRAQSFGLRIVYTNRSAASDLEGNPAPRAVDLPTLLAQSDFVSVHVPLTAQTHRLIDEAAFAGMKPTAILINTARGPIVDPDALGRALQTGRIGGAALDVTDPEPLPASHPLFACPNLLIVPHIGSATHGTRRRMAELACENLLAGVTGRPLPSCVNAAAV
jgi:lactate dehydrogenase-like 2-hydroxyacid dehydrogenase